ncbi:MAG: S8 family serine peptidase [Acidobacteriota bacterium]
MRRLSRFALLLLAPLAMAAPRDLDRWALILDDPPLAAQVSSREELRGKAAQDTARRLLAAQQRLRRELAQRHIQVTGAAHTLVNAVFVRASEEQLEALRAQPGVKRVANLPPIRRLLDRAGQLVNAQAAWNRIGGIENAGAGVKIGIIDTGIDHQHPGFQDDSLSPPPGYPKCTPGDCAYANNKVIVARSYVQMVAAGSPDNPAADSRPDDLSARDRAGHGTAVAMIAAGRTNSGPGATITGVAPKAFLGNYKVFGSPGVNDTTYSDVVIAALEDALADGMDIVTLSLGSPALYGPLDTGSICGETASQPCDVRAQAVENAVKAGLTVVVGAGNDGDIGIKFPTLTTITTPGTAPSAITVGATTNSHVWFSSVQVTGTDVPGELRNIRARFGDGPKPDPALTAPLRDVARLENDGRLCVPLATGTLAGAIALVERGDCSFAQKINYAQKAGAVGVIVYQREGVDAIFSPAFLTGTGIPAAMIGNARGKQLKSFIATRPDRAVTMDPSLTPADADFDSVIDFSSRGPAIGDAAIKPELVAVGTDLYTAAQRYDPNGEMYDRSGFTVADGTSFAVPLVAGAAALVKQQKPGLKPGQLKSAVVNTANPRIQDDSGTARVTAVGAGKLDAAAALQAGVAAEPATLSFGVLTQASLPVSRTLTLTNTGSSRLQLSLAVAPRDQDPRAQLRLSSSSVVLNAGESTQVAVRLEGSLPQPGSYEGAITIQGGGATLRVPYLYLVGDGVAFDIFPMQGYDFTGTVNARIPGRYIAFKLIDRHGAPVANVPVRFRATLGGGSIDAADERTDKFGIAAARVFLGSTLGDQQFTAEAGGLTVYFDGWARLRPTVETDGVVSAASFQRGLAVAPGSYIAIFGRGLSDASRVFSTPYLPVSLAGISVSFDVAARKISLPGRLHFVSENQVNLQVPWELEGLNSVQIKVSIGDISSAVYNLPLADYSPAFFEYRDPDGRNYIAALDENFRLLGSANLARRGRTVLLYVNGLGPVDNRPPTGEPSPSQPLAATRVTPQVTIGGRSAQVAFSGLAPFIVGLYQLNVVVPADAPSGLQPVVVTAGGVTSKTAFLPLE